MSDMLRDAIVFLRSQLQQYVSETVTYARGNQSVDVPATFGEKLLKTDDAMGNVRVEWTDMDFLIGTDVLTFGGAPFQPEIGDLIFIRLGWQIQTFEVSPYQSEAAWRYSDPYQTIYRIHTKFVGAEPYSL